ncbi:MAG: Fic family protein [Gemmatimonadota bacterium]
MDMKSSNTHPWIAFHFDFAWLEPRHWLILGEASSRIEHIIGTPLIKHVEEKLNRIYVARGLQGSAAIEGNTLTEEDVQRRLAGELELPPSQAYLGQEIDNLQRAYYLVAEGIQDADRRDLTEEQIKNFNRVILEGLALESDVTPGVYARRQHGVERYRAPSPEAIRQLMPRFVEWLHGPTWEALEGFPFAASVVRAILAHLYLAWIHPFGDGNGRTARLVEADLLARAGVPAISYHLLSSYYSQTRVEYYRVLAASSAIERGNAMLFLDYALRGLADGLKRQVQTIKQQHREIIWHDFVHAQFRGLDTPRYMRLRRLAIDLSEIGVPVPASAVRHITPRIAESYAGKTDKTLTRDIRELLTRGLVRRQGDGVVANIERLDAFVPPARQP